MTKKIIDSIKMILGKIFSFMESCSENNSYNFYRNYYQLHPSFYFNGKGIIMYGDGEIQIEANTYIGRYSSIQSSKGSKVVIGANIIFKNICTRKN